MKWSRLRCLLFCLLTGAGTVSALDPSFVPSFKDHDVIGRWLLQLGQTRHVVEFKRDHTFAGDCYQQGKKAHSYARVWSLDGGDRLIWTYQISAQFKEGEVDIDRVMAREGDMLALRSSAGVTRTWHKMVAVENAR